MPNEDFNAIMADIDRATQPHKMTLEQAKDFIERIIIELGFRLDGIKDDIRVAKEK